MQVLQELERQGALYRGSLGRVEADHLFEHLERHGARGLDDVAELANRTIGKRVKEVLALLVWNFSECGRLRPEDLRIKLQLMLCAHPGEKRSTANHLREDATSRPQIDRGIVLVPRAEHFRSTVPAGAHVLRRRHDGWGLPAKREVGHAEVADLQVTVGVHEQSAGPQIAVDYASGMNVLETTQDLVQEKLEMLLRERLVRLEN